MPKQEKWEEIIHEGAMLREGYRDEYRDGPWEKIGVNVTDKELGEKDRIALLQNARDRYWKTCEGRGIVESAVHYIIGKGIVYTAEDENPKVQEICDNFWRHPLNMMELRQKEIVKRVLRDGECFIRYFELNGMVYIRFINPEEIKDIKFSSDDAEMPEYYHREWVPKGQQEIVKKDIPANEILHIKPPWIDLDMARGRPYLEPVIKRLTQFDQFVNNRVIRNKIMAAIVLEKILHGSGATASKVSSITSGMSDVSKDADVTKASKKMPKTGSVIIHNDNIEYKWNTADVKASDCKEDARLIKTSIVTGVNAPEFILGDASNANYASTLVSENPYVRAMEDLQDTFEAYFKMIFKRVIEKAILANKLSRMSNETIVKENLIGMFMPDSDIKIIKKVKELIGQTSSKKPVETKTNVEIEFPPMVHRDLKMDTEALQIHSTMGWASDQTIAAKLGYDYEKEQKEIEQWKKEHPDEDMEYEKDRDAEIKKEKNGDTEEN